MVNPRAGWLLVPLLLAACSSTPTRGQPHLLDFIADGSTTRSEVLDHLGDPGRRMKSDDIWTWRLCHDDAGQYIARGLEAMTWKDVDASLVMVFDPDGVLRRHAVVEVRKP